MRGRKIELVVKPLDSSEERAPKRFCLSVGGESGIPCVEVKCVDIRRHNSGEGDFLDVN